MLIILLSEYSKDHDIYNLTDIHTAYLDTFSDNIKYLQTYLKAEIVFLSLTNYKDKINALSKNKIIWNLCDGIESDGYLGISLVKYMETMNIQFIGENSKSYENTSSKKIIKEILIENNIQTPEYICFSGNINDDYAKINKLINMNKEDAYIIKYDCFYTSIGLTYNNVVKTINDAQNVYDTLTYKDKLIMEKYIIGNEYTILVYNKNNEICYYTPVQKKFNEKDIYKQFITFENSQDDYISKYVLVENEDTIKNISDIAIKAYRSMTCTSYARVDLRSDNNNYYVLEINTYPSIGLNSSVNRILELNNTNLINFYGILYSSMLHNKSFCK